MNGENGENRKIFELLSFSMSIPDNFYLRNLIYLSTKHTGNPTHSLWTRSYIPISGVCRKFGKKRIKPLKIENKFMGFFVNFGVKLRLFSIKKLLYLTVKDYWTTSCYLGERFQHLNSRSVSKL